jgi:zinc and cadmium transporter
MNSLPFLLVLAFIGSVAGLIGGVVFLVKENWCKTLSFIAMPLAAGVLLSLALLDLLPEAVEVIGERAFSIVLIVIVASFLVERFLFNLHHHDHHAKDDEESSIPLVIFGDTIHNFLDGIAIGVAFIVNPTLGVFTAFATFLHETPHEIADFGILVANGWSKRRAFTANFFSALATFPGALFAYYYAGKAESTTGILLAVAAGLFLYVATTDFLPEVSHGYKGSTWKQALFLIVGILAIVIVGALIPEMH